MKKKSKAKSKAAPVSKLRVVNVKMSRADRKRLTTLARKYAKGNLSAWVRHAGSRYVPKRGEKVSLKAI